MEKVIQHKQSILYHRSHLTNLSRSRSIWFLKRMQSLTLRWITDNWQQALEEWRQPCRLPGRYLGSWPAVWPHVSTLELHASSAASCVHTGSWFPPSSDDCKHHTNHPSLMSVTFHILNNSLWHLRLVFNFTSSVLISWPIAVSQIWPCRWHMVY